MLKNKLIAIALIACGLVVTLVSRDLTALIFMAMISVPLFFSKERWVD